MKKLNQTMNTVGMPTTTDMLPPMTNNLTAMPPLGRTRMMKVKSPGGQNFKYETLVESVGQCNSPLGDTVEASNFVW